MMQMVIKFSMQLHNLSVFLKKQDFAWSFFFGGGVVSSQGMVQETMNQESPPPKKNIGKLIQAAVLLTWEYAPLNIMGVVSE